MRAALFSHEAGFTIEEVQNLPLKSGEVRLLVNACGVCGSDRQIVKGEPAPFGTRFPLIMGHEIAGTVLEIGEHVTNVDTGDPVVVYPFINCGTCAACTHGAFNLCTQQKCIGYHQSGGFAEQVIVPAEQLIKRPKHLDAAGAALLVDAYATPYHAMKKAGLQEGQTLLVIGTGGLGLAALQLSKLFRLQRVANVTQRASQLPERLNEIDQFVQSQGETRKTARAIRRWGGSVGIDVILDTIGNAQSTELAMEIVRPGGTVVIVGMSSESMTLSIAKSVRKGATLKMSYGSTMKDIEQLMAAAHEAQFDPTMLVAGMLSLEEVEHAFSGIRTSGRWVIQPNPVVNGSRF
ncbi:alcohol dehydrogenase [Pullulanibacillus camelliae]|uniref:Alcohol dehydrogenase n=1 Tax=Pullulanibacillus camelliae TaxID=1707096 RepID=A0A8J2YGL9_9BACL|nr:alcohol dehydrogenase catalytic domain-containing protein [Pullulanibacillus camelliae]GGE40107.1 alcohol dehydrogenase [Pullulanibacillus camelliae]